MKTFTDEEIDALAKSKKISPKDYMTLLFTAKQAIAAVEPTPSSAERDALLGIRDVLVAIAGKIEPPIQPLPLPSPQVNVNLPARGNWTATVTKRDRNGYIETVSFREVQA